MSDPRPPAAGERAAIGGFRPQYKVAAYLTLQFLRELEWIAVADPGVGAVDDFVFATTHEVHGLQVKWARHPEPQTLRDLTSGSPSLIRQLADGWQALRAAHRNKEVNVHLVTNKVPSTRDSHGDGAGRHTAAFLAEEFRPTQDRLRAGVQPSQLSTDSWEAAWAALRTASGLEDDDFWTFVPALNLDVNASLERPIAQTTRETANLQADIERLAGFLEDAVASPRQRVRISRQELLRDLGWTHRIGYGSAQRFPVPSEYVENAAARSSLEEALAGTPGGYITVVGSPGSGKSTLLAAGDFGRARVVQYYAYVPDLPVASERGESAEFLQDLTEQLHRTGLVDGPPLNTADVYSLKQRLSRQLDAAYDEWRDSGRETVIVIDGLDHVARSTSLHRSMFNDLPMPDAVPDGVKIILGTQTVDVLPARFQAQLEQHGRRIDLQPLDDDALLAIADAAGVLSLLPTDLRARLVQVSEGHPLTLRYLLDELLNVYTAEDEPGTREPSASSESRARMSGVLGDASSFGSDVEARYSEYWSGTAGHDDLRALLALACRVRGPLRLPWLLDWNQTSTVQKLTTTARHFFHRDGDTWFFFHASFRQFLQLQTAQTDGEFDPDIDARHHRALADAYSATADTWPVLAADEIPHRVLAKDFDGALAAASPSRLRARIQELDPVGAVSDDVAYALRAAGQLGDTVRLARYGLLQLELSHRTMALREEDLALVLSEIGAADAAVRHLRTGRTLRVDPATALKSVPALQLAGRSEEAERIARLAGNLSLLVADRTTWPGREDVALVRAWVRARYSIAGPEAVEAELDSALPHDPKRAGREPGSSEEPDAIRTLRAHALDEHCDRLVEDAQVPHRRLLDKLLDMGTDWGISVMVAAAHAAIDIGDESTVEQLLGEIEAAVAAIDHEDLAVQLVELRVRTSRSLDGIPPGTAAFAQPRLDLGGAGADDAVAAVVPSYLRHRLQHVLGSGAPATSALPTPESQRERGAYRFLTSVLELAELDAARLRLDWLAMPADPPPPATIRRILATFDVDHRDTRDWSGWYLATASGVWLFERLVEVVRRLPRGLELLIQELDRAWATSRTWAWARERRRAILTALDRAGGDRSWVEEQLAVLDEPPTETTPYDAVEDALGQARAWARMGDQARAVQSVRSAVGRAFGTGIHDEDDQLTYWVRWFFDAVQDGEFEDDAVLTGVHRMARRLRGAAIDEDRVSQPVEELIRGTWRLSPAHALALIRWADEEALVKTPELLRAVAEATAGDEAVPTWLVAHLISELYLPLRDQVPETIAELLPRAANEGGTSAAGVATAIAGGAARWALDTSRTSWMTVIRRAVEEAAITLPDGALSAQAFGGREGDEHAVEDPVEGVDQAATRDDARSLVLRDGTELTTEEVKALAGDAESLLGLLARVERGDHDLASSWRSVRWAPLVARIRDDLDATDANRLVDALVGLPASGDALAALVGRLKQLGDRRGTSRAARALLESTSLRSWSPWYDGGLRLQAWNALIEVEGEVAREEAFVDLAEALATRSIDLNGLPRHLRSYLDVVQPEVPVGAVWREIDSYLDELAPEDENSQPWEEDGGIDRNRPTSVELLTFVSDFLGHPVRVLDTAARRLLRHALMDEATSDHAAAVTTSLLPQGGWTAEAVLEVLLGVPGGDLHLGHDASDGLEVAVRAACAASDQIVRDQCRRVLRRHGWAEPADPAHRPLSPRLLLELPPLGSRKAPVIDVTGKPMLDPADVRGVIVPYDIFIESVAEEVGIDHSAAVHYCASVARQIIGSGRWLAEDSEQLQRALMSAGLRHTYRPLALLFGRRVASSFLADLVDAGRLDNDREWSSVYQLTDDRLALAWPDPRPPGVPDLHRDRSESLRGSRNWFEDLAEAAPRYAETTDSVDGVLLAEHSELVWLDWSRPRERRRWEVMPDRRARGTLITASGGRQVADGRLSTPLSDIETVGTSGGYRSLGRSPMTAPTRLIVGGGPTLTDHLAWEWIAIDPRVAVGLGWRSSEEGLFRWVARDGSFRAVSQWWVRGLTSHSPPNFDAEVGEGWRVVVSMAAIEELQDLLGPLTASIDVERSTGGDPLDPEQSEHLGLEKEMVPRSPPTAKGRPAR